MKAQQGSTPKMSKKKVDTIASDEEYVRLDIYEGRIPLGDAADRLLELAILGHHRQDTVVRNLFALIGAMPEAVKQATEWHPPSLPRRIARTMTNRPRR